MFKIVLKILAFYIILTLIVSGCSLIGEYAEGISGTPNGTAHTVPSTEGEVKEKADNRITIKNARLEINNLFKPSERDCGELSPMPTMNYIENTTQNDDVVVHRVATSHRAMFCDPFREAFEELRKRRKFYISNRNITKVRGLYNGNIIFK